MVVTQKKAFFYFLFFCFFLFFFFSPKIRFRFYWTGEIFLNGSEIEKIVLNGSQKKNKKFKSKMGPQQQQQQQ